MSRTLEELRADPRFELALVVFNGAVPTETSAPGTIGQRLRAYWRHRSSLPFALYQRFDRARYAGPLDPETPQDISPLINDVRRMTVTPRMTRFSDYFPHADVEAIRAMDVDVLLRFGFRIVKGDILAAARYGMWSFHHADNAVNRGGPAGTWEVFANEPLSGATLQILTEELDGGLVLARSYSCTDCISVTVNKQNYFWQARELLLQQLRALAARGQGVVDDARKNAGWVSYSQRLYVTPGASESFRLMWRVGKRLLARKLRDLRYREQWFLAYRVSPAGSGQPGVPDGTMYRYKELVPPSDRFWADPMPVEHNGRQFVFFEELEFSRNRGVIAVMEFDDNGPVGAPRVVLEREYHLSYPFVFHWRGDWYMLPETGSNRTVELYRARQFPYEWEPQAVFLSGQRYVDATLVEFDGRWWMFVGVTAPGASEATLLEIHHADNPLGPWLPHALNPVKVDTRSARPGGPLFSHNGRLYRPAQGGAPSYGSSIAVNRVDVLTPSEFQESVVAEIRPEWRPGLTGSHTIAACGNLSVIDVRHRVRR